MGNPVFATHPAEIEEYKSLTKLALNLRWTWNHSADEVWGKLEPELWALTQNPWLVLQTVSHEKLKAVWADTEFRERVEHILKIAHEAMQAPSWFQQTYPASPLTCVAYFSMEYMLSEALPIYSGGLGNVAGDQLKAASDLGVPVVAVGLLYQRGYFRQAFGRNGAQIALYPYNDSGQLPIKPVRDASGEWLRIPILLPGLKLWIRAWEVRVGRLTLYLLDSNDPANPPAVRGLTSELYGGGPETRIRQEETLGLAGWRLLRELGMQPEVCHLNEGHAAFAVLERARCHMIDNGLGFDESLAITRAGNVFTTHTAVDAAFDRFAPALIAEHFRYYAEERLGIGLDRLLALGRMNPHDSSESFNMANLALRGCGTVNGVSRLHGTVSRRLFQGLFPRWPQDEIPVRHVTNGVHGPTWEGDRAREFWQATSGESRWCGEMETIAQDVLSISDADIWKYRMSARGALIDYTRRRFAYQLASQGASPAEIESASRVLDPDTLTLGFARRFATYKRPNLLLSDPERLVRILTNRQQPAQLILAGKAHPQDWEGQEMIRRWNEFLRRPEVRDRVIFLSDYDMLMTQQLAQGVDVWINTPRRPWEACGTSGMKVVVNGGLNLSELDGWWAEAYSPEVGWALGDGREHDSDPAWDGREAEELYALLEGEIASAFYDRDVLGIPRRWVARIRQSLAALAPQFSANRTVREYTSLHYVPAAKAYRERAANAGALGTALVKWREQIASHWEHVRFGAVRVEQRENTYYFEVQVYLDEIGSESIRVQVYADAMAGGEPVRVTLERHEAAGTSPGWYLYQGQVPATRPVSDYTPRVVPFHPAALVPLETAEILWQR
jgi:starch phosphorylase